MAERTKDIHPQRSFRFLAEQHKTLPDVSRRSVSETTRRRSDRSPGRDFSMPPLVFPAKCPRYLLECPCRFVNSKYFIHFSVKRFNNKPRNRRSRKGRKARKDTTLMTLIATRESKNLRVNDLLLLKKQFHHFNLACAHCSWLPRLVRK